MQSLGGACQLQISPGASPDQPPALARPGMTEAAHSSCCQPAAPPVPPTQWRFSVRSPQAPGFSGNGRPPATAPDLSHRPEHRVPSVPGWHWRDQGFHPGSSRSSLRTNVLSRPVSPSARPQAAEGECKRDVPKTGWRLALFRDVIFAPHRAYDVLIASFKGKAGGLTRNKSQRPANSGLTLLHGRQSRQPQAAGLRDAPSSLSLFLLHYFQPLKGFRRAPHCKD